MTVSPEKIAETLALLGAAEKWLMTSRLPGHEIAAINSATAIQEACGIITTLRSQLSGITDETSSAVAWRVKDFADGWILFHTEAEARHEAQGAGNLVQGLVPAPLEGVAEPFLTGRGWENLPCDDQYQLAARIASNVGYVLTPELAPEPFPVDDRPPMTNPETSSDLVKRLREFTYQTHSPANYGPQYFDTKPPICDEAATTIERLTAERDEARKNEAKMKREYDAWRGFYANLRIAMETDTPAEAKVKRQARLLGEQGDRIRRLRAEVRRHLGRDPYEPRALFSLRGMIRQNEINYAKFKAAESLNARQAEALNWAMDEIDVLSNKLNDFAYPQGMAMVGRRDQLDNYRKAVDARRAIATESSNG